MVSAKKTVTEVSPEQLDDKTLAGYASQYPWFTEELIRRYIPLVKSTAARFESDSLRREDLESEAYIAVLKAIDRYDEEKCGSMSAYLSVCVTNRIISVLRRAEKTACCSDEIEDTVLDNTTPETIFIAREMDSEIEKQLSSMEYSIFRYCFDGLSYGEIAVKLDTTTKSVDNAVQRIRRKLRRIYGGNYSN